ncbi:unnamed protein product [Psylliodes chrysocephalus]|uniref:Prokaryotic-type class I peptide chain release factors domain-containing protein n=1 Tax=Psylliodes chrysocephalus TaxID=3402493 RepID=A0A9P0CST6_9CUCU|nr:unnamed protein product [Psylliodes chrysocephala]
MSQITTIQVLKLYKELLRYGKQLKLTDKNFFRRRIKQEFKNNKGLEIETEIDHIYKKGVTLLLNRLVHTLDYSKIPVLLDKDLEEMHVQGSGPGGSKINKTASCVVLKHIPSGIVVKCQETRFLEKNRKIAREILQKKLDNFVNKEESLEAQLEAKNEKKKCI